VVFNKECQRLAGSEPVEIWFPGEGEPTQMIWKFDDLPEGWTAVIEAWTVDEYKTKWKDDGYKEKKYKLFNKKKHEFKHDDKIKSSGKAVGAPFYPGDYAPVWMATLEVRNPDNKAHCTPRRPRRLRARHRRDDLRAGALALLRGGGDQGSVLVFAAQRLEVSLLGDHGREIATFDRQPEELERLLAVAAGG
jgi:hypothetical protein